MNTNWNVLRCCIFASSLLSAVSCGTKSRENDRKAPLYGNSNITREDELPPQAAEPTVGKGPIATKPISEETEPSTELESVEVPGKISGSLGTEPTPIPGALPGPVDGRYLLKGFASRKCLDVENRQRANNASLKLQTCVEDSSQKFDIAQVEPGIYRLTNVNSGKSLELQDQRLTKGTILQQNDYFGLPHQQFLISADREGTFHIKTKQAEQFIDIKDRSTSDGATIHIWDYRDQDNQLWLLLPTL